MICKRCLVTLFLTAASALTIGARAESIYRCGNTYSQSPCPGAKLLNIDDSRDPQQKEIKDEVTRRDAELAKSMEKARLDNEAALAAQRTTRPQRSPHAAKQAPNQASQEEATLVYARKPRLNRPHKTKDFVAVVPNTVRQPVKPRKPRAD